MYKEKQIIGITGRVCSGKTTLRKSMEDSTGYDSIDCDQIAKELFGDDGLKFIVEGGYKLLEEKVFPKVREEVLKRIDEIKLCGDIILLESANLHPFIDIIDTTLVCKASVGVRRYRATQENDMDEKWFDFLELLNIEGEKRCGG